MKIQKTRIKQSKSKILITDNQLFVPFFPYSLKKTMYKICTFHFKESLKKYLLSWVINGMSHFQIKWYYKILKHQTNCLGLTR